MADREQAPTSVVRINEHTERAAVDAATGEFNAILATEGEASDGHILSMRGLDMPDEIPMLFVHDGQRMPLGTLDSFKKRAGALHARGRILVDDGKGTELDFRQDVAAMVNAGGLPAMSIRWDTVKSTRRINLAKNHQHFVDATKVGPDDPRYYGHLIEKSKGREGSVVPLGADSGAFIMRAAEATSPESRVLLESIGRELEHNVESAEVNQIHTDLKLGIARLSELGFHDSHIASLIADELMPCDLKRFDYTDEGGSLHSAFVSRDAWDHLQGESQRRLSEALRLTTEAAERESVEPEIVIKYEVSPLVRLEQRTREDTLHKRIRELEKDLRVARGSIPALIKEACGKLLYDMTGRIPK
jgi:hypothetical protein